jgi:hypothetical protein
MEKGQHHAGPSRTGTRAPRLKPERQIHVGFLGPGVHFVGDLVDLSETGVLVRCVQEVEPNTTGRLGIDIGSDIVRALAVARRRVAGVGVAFEMNQMTHRDRDLLHRLLFRMGWRRAW